MTFRRLAALLSTLVIIAGACGGGDSDDGDTTAEPNQGTSTSTTGGTAPDEGNVSDEEDPMSGAFVVDLDDSRMAGIQVASYGELDVHQVESDGSEVWVTAGDAANSGDAYVARYDLTGAETARVTGDGRPLGLATDPAGRGVWAGDNFNGAVDFVDGSAAEIEASVDALSSLSTTILNEDGSIWTMKARDVLARIDPQSATVAEEFAMPFESSQSNILLIHGVLWASDILADRVTSVDLESGDSQEFDVLAADAMVLLDSGEILVAGEQLVAIDPDSGSMTELGSVVYPDKNEFFPAQFTALADTGSGLYGFDGVHGRLVRLDLDAMTAQVIDEVPIGFVGVGDLAESDDGNLWLVVIGERTAETEAHLRLYEVG